jgi:hypothetical protein
MPRETFDEQIGELQEDLLAVGDLVDRATNIGERVLFLVTGRVEELNT